MESSVDNDHFLLSLESAVFTTAPTCGGVTKAVAPLYSPTFHDGDLGDACSVEGGLGGWKDGLLYPPLPPGSPVVGFAYLGLGGVEEYEEEEDEVVEVDKGDWRAGEVGLHRGECLLNRLAVLMSSTGSPFRGVWYVNFSDAIWRGYASLFRTVAYTAISTIFLIPHERGEYSPTSSALRIHS
ncbi:hypothetical protein TSMEX_009761 [Taenia solium]|eukprot:TsM_000039800 transcript=TsM_000039800 gene=TsM_000039800